MHKKYLQFSEECGRINAVVVLVRIVGVGVNMYQVGDKIIYGSSGVCIIDGIKMVEVNYGEPEQPYYVIKPVFSDCNISVPVSTKVFMRPIITEEEALALIDSMPHVDAQPYYNNALRQLQDYYEKKINTHSCEVLVELSVSLYRKREQLLAQKRKFGAIDERYMKRAEDLLFGELSVALSIPKNEVRKFINARLGCP